jgi:hypothetical protein
METLVTPPPEIGLFLCGLLYLLRLPERQAVSARILQQSIKVVRLHVYMYRKCNYLCQRDPSSLQGMMHLSCVIESVNEILPAEQI